MEHALFGDTPLISIITTLDHHMSCFVDLSCQWNYNLLELDSPLLIHYVRGRVSIILEKQTIAILKRDQVMMSKRILRICVFAAGLWLVPVMAGARPVDFTMAIFKEPSEDRGYQWMVRVYTAAFEKLGYRFRYIVVPPARAEKMANAGLVDGEAARIIDYADEQNKMIRVPESISLAPTRILAVTLDPDEVVDGWASLESRSIKIEYLRGIAIVRKRLIQVIPPEYIAAVNEPVIGLRKLLAGRIDMYVDSDNNLMPLLSSSVFKDTRLRIAGELDAVHSYPYLHRRHAALVDSLAFELKKMKKNGLFYKFLEAEAFGIPGN